MSWDLSLTHPVTGDVLLLDSPHQMRGGTYIPGGTREASLNVTYNYSRWYDLPGVFPGSDGLESICGLSGADSIPILSSAIHSLEECEEDISPIDRAEYEKHGVSGYWLPTRANAIAPLYSLLALAKLRPDGVWMIA